MAGTKATNKNSFYRLPVLDGLEALKACGHNTSFPFHTHPTYNISIILEQTFHTRTVGKTSFAPAGAIVITNPDEVHSTICDPRTGTTFFTFYISPDALLYLNKSRPVVFEQKVILDQPLFRRFRAIADQITSPAARIEEQLLKALAELVRKYASRAGSDRPQQPFITQMMEEDLFAKFSLEKTAGKLHMDKFKFIRLFKQETGLTPNNYIILRRIEKCKELLQTRADLLDIAIETGFYDATHLCKYFKKITGVTPHTYQGAG